MNMLKNKIKRIVKRFRVKFYKWEKGSSWFKTPAEPTGYENICKAICRKMINHPDSKFTIAPLSQKRYIVNKTLGLFIIIDYNKLEITNHVYHYVIHLNNNDASRIIKSFNDKVENERIEYETEIKSNIQNTLNTILDKITRETSEK